MNQSKTPDTDLSDESFLDICPALRTLHRIASAQNTTLHRAAEQVNQQARPSEIKVKDGV